MKTMPADNCIHICDKDGETNTKRAMNSAMSI